MDNLQVVGGESMTLETKVLLVAIARLVEKSKSVEEAFNHVVELATVEGIKIEPWKEKDENKK